MDVLVNPWFWLASAGCMFVLLIMIRAWDLHTATPNSPFRNLGDTTPNEHHRRMMQLQETVPPSYSVHIVGVAFITCLLLAALAYVLQ